MTLQPSLTHLSTISLLCMLMLISIIGTDSASARTLLEVRINKTAPADRACHGGIHVLKNELVSRMRLSNSFVTYMS